MKNYISINGQKTELTEEQVKKIKESFAAQMVKLADNAPGDVVKVGDHEFVVLEHRAEGTLLLRKDSLGDMSFGNNNNYDGSDADAVCNQFAKEIAVIVGEENIITHEVDLTANDGLKDYGIVKRKASLRTAQMQREYVEILDKYRLDGYELLATAYSTPTHNDSTYVLCVSPSGNVNIGSYYYRGGVRPFCILNSNIFVSI